MVLDFFKRKKRLSEVSLGACQEVPGLYTRKWEEDHGEEGGRGEHRGSREGEQGGRGEPNPPLTSPPHLTWDTLKRIRRERSAVRGQSGSVQCLLSDLSKEEMYQSSPNIREEDLRSLPATQGVLQFTRE